MKIIEHKSETFFIFKRYQARNQKNDFKIRYFRIDYNEKYKNYDFDYYRIIKTYLESLLFLRIPNKTESSNDLIKHFSI